MVLIYVKSGEWKLLLHWRISRESYEDYGVDHNVLNTEFSYLMLFLSVDTKPLTGFPFYYSGESFFVDEEEEVALVLDEA
ncbi:hypothetical protein IGI04_029028 [Brassica rapa subsp. trilocularis]|uniref:F-box associated domain-containing protein n=1 Tax=Brassica rapa subsp. trilocularis TaxID=1813537 RepID=A0ABQ7L7H2_BRACM|nr:hypothetical protein IGI04_029028 [Brassica rapa subsp. trilocularis]